HQSSRRPHYTPLPTPSLHDALPISRGEREHHALARFDGKRTANRENGIDDRAGGAAQIGARRLQSRRRRRGTAPPQEGFARGFPDRKSTRLNSSHQIISYAVFCLKR